MAGSLVNIKHGSSEVSASNPFPVTTVSSSLPSGAATSANQSTEIARLDTIITHVDGLEAIGTSTNTKLDTVIGHVDGIETNQATGNSSLSSIDTKSTRAFSSGTNSRPTATTTSSTILAANSNRKYAYIFNNAGTAVYIKLNDAAVTNQGIRIAPNTMYEINNFNLWTGTVQAIVGAGSVTLDVFEGT